MRSLLRHLRFLAAVQLLPALESGEETTGRRTGRAGRRDDALAACVGHLHSQADGTLATHSEPLEQLSDKHKWMAWPFVRGMMTLGQAMALGFRALRYSANVALGELPPEEEKKTEISGWVLPSTSFCRSASSSSCTSLCRCWRPPS